MIVGYSASDMTRIKDRLQKNVVDLHICTALCAELVYTVEILLFQVPVAQKYQRVHTCKGRSRRLYMHVGKHTT